MTPEQQQEEISKAYLHAVAAQCGFALGNWTQDHGGVDVTVGAPAVVGAGYLARPKIDIQLKATRQASVVKKTFISWPLDADHYDKLIAPAMAPHLLVVLLLPPDVTRSVHHTVKHLLIRRCAYWATMTGLPAIKPSAGTKSVRLPKSQMFSPVALQDIMEKVSQGVVP